MWAVGVVAKEHSTGCTGRVLSERGQPNGCKQAQEGPERLVGKVVGRSRSTWVRAVEQRVRQAVHFPKGAVLP